MLFIMLYNQILPDQKLFSQRGLLVLVLRY